MASLLESSYSTSIIENLLDQIQRLKSDLKEKTDLLTSSENRQKSLEKTILSLSATCREQECTIQELEEMIEELEADDNDGNNEERNDVEMDDSGIGEEDFENEYEDLDDEEMDEEEEEEDPATQDDDDSDYEATDESEDEDLEETLDAADLAPSGSSVAPCYRNDSVFDVGKEQTAESENNVEMVAQNPKTRRVNLIDSALRHSCEEESKEEQETLESSKIALGFYPTVENAPVVKDEWTERENGVQRVVQAPKKAMKTFWECQLCGVECSAHGNLNLQRHAGVHTAFHMPCVVKGCTEVSKELQTLRNHLTSKHKKRASHLNKVERQKLKDLCHEFWRKTKPLQSVFFPVTAFVGYAGKQRSGAAVKCKKCGASVAARNSVRIAHVLSHIKVRSECPIGGCNRVFAGLKELHRHLEKDHRTNLMKMAESEIQKFIEGQTRVNGAANSVFYQYFDSVEV